MKKLFLSLIILASVSLTAFSQKSENRRGNRQNAAKELNLTEDQQQKMKSINEDFKSKIDALKADQSLSKEAKQDKMKELFGTKRTEMQALLTPEQQTKMKEMREKRKNMPRRGHQKFSQRSERPKRMGECLNLSEEQKIKMRSLNESFKKQMQDLRADNSLDKDARNAKRKELATAHKEELNSILTPEQQAKMKNNFEKGRKNFKKDGKFQGKKGRGDRHRLDTETTAKLDELKENFIKEKKAVELSRIAPEAQKERIRELREKYRSDRKAIVEKARDNSKS